MEILISYLVVGFVLLCFVFHKILNQLGGPLAASWAFIMSDLLL